MKLTHQEADSCIVTVSAMYYNDSCNV